MAAGVRPAGALKASAATTSNPSEREEGIKNMGAQTRLRDSITGEWSMGHARHFHPKDTLLAEALKNPRPPAER